MAKLVIPHIFTPGTPAQASQMNANFDAISNWSLSGQIETDSIKFPLESRSNDNQNNTRPILKFVQTIDEKILELQNAEGSSSIYISQTEELNANTGIIHINDAIAQTESASAAIKLVLSSVATAPAILITHGSETLRLTKSDASLFAAAVEINAARIKVPVRNTADKLSVTQEGSVVYDSTKKELAFRTNNSWIPASTPTGCIQMFAGSTAPQGWLLCNGSEYLKGDYSELNQLLSDNNYPYGQTNGSGGAGTTHFKVPDLRGAFVRGTGTNSFSPGSPAVPQTGPALGQWQDDATALNGIAAQTGTQINTNNTSPKDLNHTHNIQAWTNLGENNLPATTNQTGTRNDITTGGSNTNLDHRHTITSSDTETRPFSIGLNYIIKY